MSTQYCLPKPADSKELLTMLFGDEPTIKPGKPLDIKAGSGNIVAVYIADDEKPVAFSVCDLSFAAFASSSLSLIPAGGAKDAIKSGKLSDSMWANLHEIMNIMSRLLMDSNTAHLKLGALYEDPKRLLDDARSVITAAKQRVDLEVGIPRYGNGRISLLIT